jgi:hypothetical protein
MTGADNRPRIHIWTSFYGVYKWSIGPAGTRSLASSTPGMAIDGALKRVDAAKGAIVIIEPAEGGR